jgi:hypothetical protein
VKHNGKNTAEFLIGRKQVLSAEVEEVLVWHSHLKEQKYYELQARNVKRVSYSLGITKAANYLLSVETQTAGSKSSND